MEVPMVAANDCTRLITLQECITHFGNNIEIFIKLYTTVTKTIVIKICGHIYSIWSSSTIMMPVQMPVNKISFRIFHPSSFESARPKDGWTDLWLRPWMTSLITITLWYVGWCNITRLQLMSHCRCTLYHLLCCLTGFAIFCSLYVTKIIW